MTTTTLQTSRGPSHKGDLPRVCDASSWPIGSFFGLMAASRIAARWVRGALVPQRRPNPTEPHIQKDPSLLIPLYCLTPQTPASPQAPAYPSHFSNPDFQKTRSTQCLRYVCVTFTRAARL